MLLSERQKIILRLLGLVGVAALMGVALYFLFFRRPPTINQPPIPADNGPTDSPGLPTAGTGQPGSLINIPNNDGRLPVSPVANGGITQTTLLTNTDIMSPIATVNGSIAYYDPNDGKFYTIDAQGNAVTLSAAKFPGAENVVFADDASAAVIEFPDGSQIAYDFAAAQQTSLPSHWEDFSFSSDGQSIVTKSVGLDPSTRALVVTATNGSNTQVIAELGSNDDRVLVDWSPSGQILGFSKTGDGGNAFGQNEVFLIGQDGEAAGVLIVNGSNFQPLWSPDGNNLFYSVADAGDEYRSSLWYADSQGDRTGDTRLRLSLKTSVDKCTFASSTLAYCAVPTDMPVGGGVSKTLVTSEDNLYSIALPAGRTNLVAIPNSTTQMFNLNVSPDGSELFYTDNFGRLNVIQLK